MANTCLATVIFSGNNEILEKIKATLITTDSRNFTTINYDYIRPHVPDMRNKYLFSLLNLDYYDFINYSDIEPKKLEINREISKFLQENNWIGLHDDYINSIYSIDIVEKPGKLILHLEMPWYCPNSYFIYVAESLKAQVTIIEKIQGNWTILIYLENGRYCCVKTGLDSSINLHFIKNAVDAA